MALITGYPDGSDITIMNATYVRGKKTYRETEGGDFKAEYGPDYIWIVYRDNNDGRKYHKMIKNPDYHYYMIKPDKAKPYNRFFVPIEDTEEVKCKYRDLLKDIAKRTGNLEQFKNNCYAGNFKANQRFHANPNIFSSDMNIEDHYRARFGEAYTNNNFTLHKAFFDIEADSINMAGDFPELGECPVNAISLYDAQYNTIFSFLLRTKSNPLISKFEEEAKNPKLYKEVYDFIVDTVGGQEAADEFGITGVKVEFHFYDSEISMLKKFFEKVHSLDPDFIEAWNMAFDIPYMIQRIVNLDYDPKDIMCNDKYEDEIKEAFYYIDQRHYNDYAERTDFATITGNPVWIDQMLQFAQKRKAKIGSFTSFKLNDIAKDTVGVRKLDYSHITHDIAKLPYLDYKTFVFYNIIDTVCQKCIEARTKDLENIFTNCLVNNTSYRKGYRQTVYLANRIIKDFKEKGFIVGNNVNRIKAQEPGAKKPEKYAGAIVTDVTLTGPEPRMEINGVKSMIVDNVIDEDYKALYPSCELENNIAPHTQIGKIVMWNKWHAIFNYENGSSEVWVMDLENAHDWPTYPESGDKDEDTGKKKKRFKKVKLFKDPDYRIPFEIEEVEYHPENFKTLSYEKIYDNSNLNRDEKYEMSGEFIENYMCHNSIIFSNRYFRYATFKQFILEDLPEYFKKISEKIKIHKYINPIIHCQEEKINPIIEYNDGPINPIIEEFGSETDWSNLTTKLKTKL